MEVSPILGPVQLGSEMEKVDPFVMDVLNFLAFRSGQTVLREELLTEVWSAHDASDENLTLAISILRKVFRKLDPKTRVSTCSNCQK